ncbi:hypothetical protein OS189_14415 [Sulfitobacter sp. F26169L]|uniref:hypothetical protein n=1 Tax=Sulfitobacter sp. F26169L TaxID=2996015 RepID=UPI002260E226|nr:hypothetical protein [Sulfitobacter sp. F26169L]MCX7567536.1 hypothetical protein [Sulfitobacter sp. F26169L]
MELLLNGLSLGFLRAGVRDGLKEYQFVLSAADQQIGDNPLEFVQSIDNAYHWGVTELTVSDDPFAII